MRRPAWLAALPLLAACGAQPPAATVAPVAAVPAIVAAPMPAERRVLLTVPFAVNSHAIPAASRPLLDNLAEALRDPRLAAAEVEINGHTDASGRLPWNIALSFLRASAVVEGLRSRGVAPASGLRAQGFGPLQPLDPARPLDPGNRRVEVVVIHR